MQVFRTAAIYLMLPLLLAVSPAVGRAQEVFTLSQAVSRALEKNFTIVSATAGRDAATSGRRAATSDFAPSATTGYEYLRRQYEISPSGSLQDPELYTWRAGLSQNVFAGFSTLSAYQKAALAEESATAGVNKARIELIRTVQEHFFTYLKARQNVRSSKDSLDRLKLQLASSDAFYKAGLTPRLDVLQAEVDVSTAESVLLIAENTVEQERTRLNTLLILPLEQKTEYAGDLAPMPFGRSLEACLAKAYAHRPDLLIADKAVAIADKDVSLAQKDYYPRVDFFVGWATMGDDAFSSGSRYMNNRYSGWTCNVTVQWAFFDWGKTYFREQQAKRAESKLKADAENLRQDVTYEVKARLLDMREAAKRIKVAQKTVEQAGEAYRHATARYKSQVGTMTDVLSAQGKWSLAEAMLVGAKADYSIALSRLYAAMGEENIGLAAK